MWLLIVAVLLFLVAGMLIAQGLAMPRDRRDQ
jgi:uncharacterized integral membrane protein